MFLVRRHILHKIIFSESWAPHHRIRVLCERFVLPSRIDANEQVQRCSNWLLPPFHNSFFGDQVAGAKDDVAWLWDPNRDGAGAAGSAYGADPVRINKPRWDQLGKHIAKILAGSTLQGANQWPHPTNWGQVTIKTRHRTQLKQGCKKKAPMCQGYAAGY